MAVLSTQNPIVAREHAEIRRGVEHHDERQGGGERGDEQAGAPRGQEQSGAARRPPRAAGSRSGADGRRARGRCRARAAARSLCAAPIRARAACSSRLRQAMSNTSAAMPMSNAESDRQGGVVLGPRADRGPRQAIDDELVILVLDRIASGEARRETRQSSAAPCRRRGPHCRRPTSISPWVFAVAQLARTAVAHHLVGHAARRHRAAARTPARRAPSSRRTPPGRRRRS